MDANYYIWIWTKQVYKFNLRNDLLNASSSERDLGAMNQYWLNKRCHSFKKNEHSTEIYKLNFITKIT